MDFINQHKPGNRSNRCTVCDAPIVINPLHADQPRICGNVQCQALFKQQHTMSPALYKQHFARQQQLILQKRHVEVEKQKHIERLKQAEHEENERIASGLKAYVAGFAHQEIRVTQLPSGLAEAAPPEPERIQAYCEHLQDVISQAEAAESIESLLDGQHSVLHESLINQDQRLEDNPALEQGVQQMCGLCKGGCCSAGGNHGYLQPITMRRLMELQGMSAESLLAYYRERIPLRSVVGACINQTREGCSVPREFRSDVCNFYLCEEVELYLDSVEYSESGNTCNLVVQRENTHWNRFEAVEKNPVKLIAVQNEEGELVPLAHGEWLGSGGG
ncbi:MAG: hypothetical protein VYA55_14220 [Pseudomonadota bacterium]|nr:hypothetical protein [Pseudomonadota bacterium]